MAIDLVMDASALVAIVRREPGNEAITQALLESQEAAIPAPTVLEAAMVIGGNSGLDPRNEIGEILRNGAVRIAPFDDHLYGMALTAFMRFGKGRHRASLNFGDCMVYALAARHRAPILCAGNNFAQTDIAIAKLDN